MNVKLLLTEIVGWLIIGGLYSCGEYHIHNPVLSIPNCNARLWHVSDPTKLKIRGGQKNRDNKRNARQH
jgi:hypothetical protein